MHWLQVCNVGNIVGGTAACAWSVTRALPECEHTVWFRTPPTRETRRLFGKCRVLQGPQLPERELQRLQPEVLLLHNTPRQGVSWQHQPAGWSGLSIQFHHSGVRGKVVAEREVACSEYLRDQLGGRCGVLYQGVSQPEPPTEPETRGLRDGLVIGRICTPSARKWPETLQADYARWAEAFPRVEWEFVGCPQGLQAGLKEAVRGRARFWPAGWEARRLMWTWHALLYSQPGCPETFGRVAAEAMRCGCVPLVDAAGGFLEQVRGEAGFCCSSWKDFADAINTLHRPGGWCHATRRCRVRGEEFSLLRFRRQLLNLLSASEL